MEPRIQYCTSADGTRIAYAVMGEGPLLLTTPSSWESVGFVLQDSIGGPFYNPLAANHTVVRYDRRGTGLSDRDRTDFTLDSEVQDIEAVVDSVGIKPLALMGGFHLGPAAISFVARHPDEVSHLILYGTFARGRDLTRDEVKASLISMVRSHWGMGSRMLGDITAPDIGGETQELLARDERDSTSGETVARLIEMSYELDVTELLQQVRLPTLVIHRRGDRAIPFRKGRELAAALPNAKLVVLEGVTHWPWFGDTNSVLRALKEYIGGEAPLLPTAAATIHTILFTDIEGSTALTERLGDAKAREVLREHERLVREALKSHGGSEIKTMGDGFMASFGSATKALECAVAIQRSLTPDPSPVGTGEGQSVMPLKVRIGLNAGEPVTEEGDLFGTAVNMAARIAGQAQGGEILVSDVVRQLVAGKGFSFEDRGEQALKGFEEPVRVYGVRWAEEGSS